ncbi:MAG TPA: [acyl-carrier-protein] S-malonyltransferase [Chloroflexi bacterium]|nr:[acyl-carrier-protein] S-malonyltransferase [Chloroflexota bacterium]
MLDQTTTAFIFPGQGSQAVGMGLELAEQYPVARQTFEEADALLGFPLSKLCFEGPEEELTDTINAQPALYVAGIAALRTLYEELGEPFTPAFVAGHSLGELTALTAAGALSFPDGLRLVRRRGELMKAAGQHSPGGMAALLGLDIVRVEAICAAAREETGGIVVVANDNCPGQVVIAGDEETLGVAMKHATEAGARRVVRLPITIAAHSPLMARVAEDFRAALAETPFHRPIIPIIGNTQASPLTTEEEVRAELGDQLTSPVRWTESVRAMLDAGVTTFVELGSKDVLSGLLKRIDRSTKRYVVDSPEGIARLLQA